MLTPSYAVAAVAVDALVGGLISGQVSYRSPTLCAQATTSLFMVVFWATDLL